MEIKNILCPVDFSEFSLTAFTYATCIALRLRSRLIVQHTVEVPASVYIGCTEPGSDYHALDDRLVRAEARMRRLSAVARLHLNEIRMLVNEGDTRERVMQTVRREKIDLVIMGGCERGLNSLAWRSLTAQVIHDANCPVLVISRPQHDFVRPGELRPVHLETILVATDFSSNADLALAEALLWAAKCSARIVLLHAENAALPAISPEQQFEQQLARVCKQSWRRATAFPYKGSGIVSEFRHGDAKTEILDVADEVGADLIVMGKAGAGTSARPWGSTIAGVVRDGRFPVLAVPAAVAASSEASCV